MTSALTVASSTSYFSSIADTMLSSVCSVFNSSNMNAALGLFLTRPRNSFAALPVAIAKLSPSIVFVTMPFWKEDITEATKTFYYIALRKQNNIAERIGRRFAMLCGKENHENLEKIGSGLYLILCRIICEEIENTSFIID